MRFFGTSRLSRIKWNLTKRPRRPWRWWGSSTRGRMSRRCTRAKDSAPAREKWETVAASCARGHALFTVPITASDEPSGTFQVRSVVGALWFYVSFSVIVSRLRIFFHHPHFIYPFRSFFTERGEAQPALPGPWWSRWSVLHLDGERIRQARRAVRNLDHTFDHEVELQSAAARPEQRRSVENAAKPRNPSKQQSRVWIHPRYLNSSINVFALA